MDKFFRTIGLHKSAKESIDNMDQVSLEVLQSYADGVNDYLDNIALMKSDYVAKLLPPEFYILNHTNPEPWTPTDSICLLKLFNFYLSWNWNQDRFREVIAQAGLEDLVEEILPFSAEYMHNLVTVLDEDDIKGTKHWSPDESITEKYYKSKGKKYVRKLSKKEKEEADRLK